MAYMNKLTLALITFITCSATLLSGCGSLTKNQHQQITEHQSIQERTTKLQALSQWKINGKLAIINPEERHSLTLNWHFQGDKNHQKLNLTTLLGIQVFNLESVSGMHVIEVDGERYQSTDLNELLASLTGLTLPTQALTYWLKGIPYLGNDKITYSQETSLPQSLLSQYNEKQWLIKYRGYQQVEQFQLASNFTITQQENTIKIKVHQWDVSSND